MKVDRQMYPKRYRCLLPIMQELEIWLQALSWTGERCAKRAGLLTLQNRYSYSWRVSCDELSSHALTWLDETPIARGYSKAVWRASLHNRTFVIKRPADANSSSGQTAFFLALKQELKFLVRLGRQANVMQYYGSCHTHKSPSNALAVEGPLVAWRAVVGTSIGWSARLHVARSVASLFELLHAKRLIHCDWKADQVSGKGW
jgi:hypothetical protein